MSNVGLKTSYEKIAHEAGWKKCYSDSKWSWEKRDGVTLRGHWKVDLYSGRSIKMTAQELCEKEMLL